MSIERMGLNPRIGDSIIKLIERDTGKACHITLIVCPIEGGKLGQPEFITSLQPDEMENLIVQIGGSFAFAGKRTVTGGTFQ